MTDAATAHEHRRAHAHRAARGRSAHNAGRGHLLRYARLQTPGAHGWLVGHASESRAFYLLLEGRECSWSEVHHEVQSLCHVHFSNIYFTE